MDVLGDAIARDRRSRAPALLAPALDRRYDYRRFCTTAWKVGNFLRHLGARTGALVAIADAPRPESVLTFYGTALLGGVVRFVSPLTSPVDTRVLVVDAADLDDYEYGPSTTPLVYGQRHDDPSAAYFERDVWSENPTEPPDRVASEDALLWTPETTFTHAEVLAAATAVCEERQLGSETTVTVDSSFADPAVVAAGLVAPILAGGHLSLGETETADEDVVRVGGSSSDVDCSALRSDWFQ